jgi:hypothetical protein
MAEARNVNATRRRRCTPIGILHAAAEIEEIVTGEVVAVCRTVPIRAP